MVALQSFKFINVENSFGENVYSFPIDDINEFRFEENGIVVSCNDGSDVLMEYDGIHKLIFDQNPASLETVDLMTENKVAIYYDYINKSIEIRSDVAIGYADVTDLRGISMFLSQEPNGNNVSVDASGYSKGVYIVRVVLENGETKMLKVLIK